MKRKIIVVMLVLLMLGMAACGAAEAAMEDTTVEESSAAAETIGQAMVDGTLYGITEETTGIAFSEENTLTPLNAIPSGQVPKNDGDCNLDAQELQLYDGGDCYVVIADGTQYIIKK